MFNFNFLKSTKSDYTSMPLDSEIKEPTQSLPSSEKPESLFMVGVDTEDRVTLTLSYRGTSISLSMSDEAVDRLVKLLNAAKVTNE